MAIVSARRGEYILTEQPVVRYVEHTVDHPKQLGGLIVNNVERTGKFDRKRLEVWEPGRGYACVAATAAGVKSAIRVLREREAQEIAECDAEIERLREEIAAAQQRRKAALRNAWQRGNVYRLQDALAIADSKLP